MVTELVRFAHQDRGGLLRSLCVALLTWTLALAPVTAWAAPAQGSAPEGPVAPASETPPAEIPEVAAIRSALEAGDLTSARELAVARSEAEPSSENLLLEAEVHRALGDYDRAKAALDRAIAALPEQASSERAALVQLRDEIEASARGTKADEPPSSHREQLDRERAERVAALAPKPTPAPEPVDEPKPREPIIKKWYFWVTLGAIVAVTGAIIGVAVQSNVEARDAEALGRQGSPAGGLTLRF